MVENKQLFNVHREEFRETSQNFKAQSNTRSLSSDVTGIKVATSKISRGQSLLQCHMCNQQGFTTIALKVNIFK